MADEENSQIVFKQDKVFLRIPNQCTKDDVTLCGQLRVTERNRVGYVEWHSSPVNSMEMNSSDVGHEQDWDMINSSVGYKNMHGNEAESPKIEIKTNSAISERWSKPIIIELSDLGSIKVHGRKWELMTLIQKDGTTHPVLKFTRGDVNNYLACLERYVFLKQSSKDVGFFRVLDLTAKDLEKSFNELQLFGEQTSDFVSRFVHDPYTTTLGSFSKVTNYLYDYIVTSGKDDSHSPNMEHEMAEILHNSLSTETQSVNIDGSDEPGFEVITCIENLGPRPDVKRSDPLTFDEWQQYVDSEGRVICAAELRERIFRGGLTHSLRCDVWKYLLRYFDYDSTSASRQDRRKKKVEDYFRMKLQWKSISEDQERRFAELREKKNLVEKDVSRTDRTHPFYTGDNNANIQLMYDILMTYCMYNFDLGYVQGMSDLLSPILLVTENEVDTFWCFVGFMDRVARNFEMDQQGMKTQLSQLSTILRFSDAQLYDYFESHDSGNLYFSFRWLLIIFKREFMFTDIMRLWEVMWTDLPCKNFHLLCCLAILDTGKNTLMDNHFGFTEILKYINDLSHNINLDEVLRKAESIYLQLEACQHTPNSVREIIGLPLLTPSTDNKRSNIADTSPATTASSSSQLNTSIDNSSIEVLPDDAEARFQTGLDLNYT